MQNLKRLKYSILLVALFFSLLACNFPLWSVNTTYPETELRFQTQIPHNVSFPTRIPTIDVHPSPPQLGDLKNRYTYNSQSGDTLQGIARHFGVDVSQVSSEQKLPDTGLLSPGTVLFIPKAIASFYYADILLPDSEVIYSPSVGSFDINDYINRAGGYLAQYSGTVQGERLTGAQIVEKVSKNTSVNPMLLLAFIELRSHWLTQTPPVIYWDHPLDLGLANYEGLYLELAVAARYINTGYYGWRSGQMTDLIFSDGTSARIAPNLNAGTVGIQYLLAQLYTQPEWETMMYGESGLISIYTRLFGDAFARSNTVEPLFSSETVPPTLELPFAPGEKWALTGGLHEDWTAGTPWGALDFAPLTGEGGCVVSKAWVLAAAPGEVTRASNNQVIIALEDEQGNPTGWEVFYMHIAKEEMVAEGTQVKQDDRIGHPSCQGGSATGTHVHITRKYKGEWIGAKGPFPLILSGWLAIPGDRLFVSSLVKNGQAVTADPNGANTSQITR